QPACTPRCALVTHGRHRGKTGRSLRLGDIRKTTTSLLAPFYKVLDDQTDGKSSVRHSTLRTKPRTRRSTMGSRASSTNGPKVRPCIIMDIAWDTAEAQVCLMGTFEGRNIDELHPYVAERLAVLFAPDCAYKGDWVAKGKTAHMHSTPDWSQAEGKLQYIVPLIHDVELSSLDKRWAISRDGDSRHNNPEGYYMDSANLYYLSSYTEKVLRGLQRNCADKGYRRDFRQVLREKWTVDGPPPARNPNCSDASVKTHHSRAPSVVTALEPIPETRKASAVNKAAAPTPEKTGNSWFSGRKISVSSTSSRSTASKRRSVYDDECPRTPKAAKQEFDTSSTYSRGSKRLFPFMKSSKANTPVPLVASRNKHEALTCQ
ncbi:hypothetical protein GGF50DRAFT_53625, partial [Schizophyllum commune]